MQEKASALALVVFVLMLTSPATGQILGIYADLQSTHCSIYAARYDPTNFYVNVVGTGILSPPGMQGAEFQISHTISSGQAVLTYVANPLANVVLGNPLEGGCNIAFPSCQTGVSINLYTVQVVVLDEQAMANQVLRIEPHPFGGPNFPCVEINECDAPIFTTVCVQGGRGCINDTLGQCVIDPIEAQTWSKVKSLYH